jgi:thioredoxin-dependent peroxiredoxin
VGDRAPDFSLRAQDGSLVTLSDLIGRGNLVLFFYPKDRTPGCTAEAGAFRDAYAALKERGAEIVGVSSDSVESHKGFAEECELPFRILSDEDGELRRSFGVRSTMGIVPGRVTYIIDREGEVRSVFSSQFQATRHAKEALEFLDRIGKEP